MFDIQEELKKLPDKPGVYIHRDAFGQVIYVGKAVSLKRRVRQYFQSPKNHAPKVRKMVENIAEFEYITTGSEMEALVLECNLIKKYTPKYNVVLRDDKTYPYIKVTLGEKYPRILKTRRIVTDGSKYFGPYPDAGAVNTIIDLLNDIYELKRCNASSFPPGFTPCLNFHIKKCRGICRGDVDRDEYMENVRKALDMLSGRSRELTVLLKEKMEAASEELRFEDAAVYRNYLNDIAVLMEKQRVVLSHPEDLDIVLVTEGLSGAHAVLFTVRAGKLSGRESFFLGDSGQSSREELAAEFIKQYYYENVMIPKEILVAKLPHDHELLENWLGEQRGSSVTLLAPARGEKRALMELVKKDVGEMLKDIDERARRQLEKEESVRLGLSEVFGELSEHIHRIESYDISNINGVDSVGAMVVFYDGHPMPKAYRRFKIKTVEGPDDTGSLQEVLFRRLRDGVNGVKGFEELPDLIVMDGGLGQIHAAQAVMKALRIDIPVAGLAKDDKHRTRALIYEEQEYPLRSRSDLFAYLGAIQEEVHRFAIDYHHRLRGKQMTRSVLDGIPGIGEKRKMALLSHFGSVDAIKSADAKTLAAAPGMNLKVAESVREYFAAKDAKNETAAQQPLSDEQLFSGSEQFLSGGDEQTSEIGEDGVITDENGEIIER